MPAAEWYHDTPTTELLPIEQIIMATLRSHDFNPKLAAATG